MAYFVSKNGNDKNPGTEEKPFRTIQRGVNALSERGSLYIKAGKYHEKVTINKENVFVSCFENDKVVIDGRVGLDGSINSGLPTGNLNKVAPDGKGGTENGLFDITASDVSVYGLEVVRSRGKGIRVFSRTNEPVRDVAIVNCKIDETRRHALLVDAHNVQFLHGTIRGSGSYYTENRAAAKSTDWSAAIAVKGKGFLFQFNLVERNFGEAIAATPNRPDFKGEVSYNVFKNNFRAALFQVFSKAHVHHNLFLSTPNSQMPGGAVGVNIAQGEDPGWGITQDMIFENNIIAGFDTGLRISGQPWRDPIKKVRVLKNTIFKCKRAIIPQSGNAKDMRLSHNLVYKCAKQIDDLYNGRRFASAWTNGPGFWQRPVGHPYSHPNDRHGDPGFKNENVDLNFPNNDWDLSAFKVKDGLRGFGADFHGITVGPDKDDEPPIDPPVEPGTPPRVNRPFVEEVMGTVWIEWEYIPDVTQYNVQEIDPEGRVNLLDEVHVSELYMAASEETGVVAYGVGTRTPGKWCYRIRASYDGKEFSQPSEPGCIELSKEPPPEENMVSADTIVGVHIRIGTKELNFETTVGELVGEE